MNKIEGKCALCGKISILSYEHVPPRSAFNNQSAKVVRGEQLVNRIESGEEAFDFQGIRWDICQQGAGGYYLCRDCNANTGAWYIPHYMDFVYGIATAIEAEDPQRKSQKMLFETGLLRPLPIFKEIMVMFCDVNGGCFEDEKLRQFLLNKDDTASFDRKKYRVFCYIIKGENYRMNGLYTKILTSPGKNPIILQLSEISFYPLGFVLYIDLPDDYKPIGCEITCLSNYVYDDKERFNLLLSILENNTVFSGDYRRKEELQRNIPENS